MTVLTFIFLILILSILSCYILLDISYALFNKKELDLSDNIYKVAIIPVINIFGLIYYGIKLIYITTFKK